jgi:hypothetical protein
MSNDIKRIESSDVTTRRTLASARTLSRVVRAISAVRTSRLRSVFDVNVIAGASRDAEQLGSIHLAPQLTNVEAVKGSVELFAAAPQTFV